MKQVELVVKMKVRDDRITPGDTLTQVVGDVVEDIKSIVRSELGETFGDVTVRRVYHGRSRTTK